MNGKIRVRTNALPALLLVSLTTGLCCAQGRESASGSPAAPGPGAGKVTTVTLTDKVLVKDTMRLGINLGGDAYYSGAALVKKRARENFEGTTYRQCHWGPVWKDNGLGSWFGVGDAWKKVLVGAKYTVLSGPSKGTTGTIKDITTVPFKNKGKMLQLPFFVLDKTITPPPANGGLLVESFRLNEGSFRKLDGHWVSKNDKLVIGDPPPGSFGVASLNLDGSKERAHVRFSTHYQRYGETNGTWNVHLWAKAKSGEPKFLVSASAQGGSTANEELTLTGEWKKYEVQLKVDKVPEPKSAKGSAHLTIVLVASGGEVLVDDVEAWMDGETNPTAFRDDCVAALKKFNPGCIRFLQMGGNTVANCLQPPIRAHAYTSRGASQLGPYVSATRTPYSLHQLYELCEYIDSEPWYCLPGTIGQDEMAQFMEYIGAPADVGYGKVRAELGHPKPWTETLKNIHVEFGNEAWNNAGPYQKGGFNGPDYWKDLIAVGKSSKHYRKNVIFHSAGQAASSGRNQAIMANAPNADRHSVAPYMIQRINKADMKLLDTDEKLDEHPRITVKAHDAEGRALVGHVEVTVGAKSQAHGREPGSTSEGLDESARLTVIAQDAPSVGTGHV